MKKLVLLCADLKKVTATDIATTVAKSKPKKALNKTTTGGSITMYMMHPIEIELTQVSIEGIISIITIEALQVAMGRNSISAITSEHMNNYVFNSDSMLWVSELTGENTSL